MNYLYESMSPHPTIWAMGAYFVFSALVSGMPEPGANDGKGYVWAYRSLHALAGDLASAVGPKFQPKP